MTEKTKGTKITEKELHRRAAELGLGIWRNYASNPPAEEVCELDEDGMPQLASVVYKAKNTREAAAFLRGVKWERERARDAEED